MNEILHYFSPFRWRQSLSARNVFKYLLSSLGTLWLITEIASFFSDTARAWLTGQWWLFLFTGLILVLTSSRPKNCYSCRLNGRDVVIEIRTIDAFKVPGSLIIPTNSLFDNNLGGIISQSPSIQSRFIREFYDNNCDHLDLDTNVQLSKEGYQFNELSHEKLGLKKEYDIGSVIQLSRKDRHFYMLALTRINNQGRACCSVEELKVALAELWYYISKKGNKAELVIPLIGTGHARLPTQRDEVARTIIRSFIASCSSRNYCNKLVIALYPPDVDRYEINLEELWSFLEHTCKYTMFDISDTSITNNEIERQT